MPSWLHLCPVHPGEALALVAPAMIVLALLVPGRLRAALALAREPLGHGGGGAPRVIALGARIALLHGWLRPTLVVDRALWQALSEGERAAILAHERGHLQRRDPLVLMGLRLLLVIAPPRLANAVARAWLDRAERLADAAAARSTGDPVQVASALLRCARLGNSAPALAMAWTGGELEHRVRVLLDPSLHPGPTLPDLGLLDVALLAVLGALGVAATPWVHHQVEHLLNLSL